MADEQTPGYRGKVLIGGLQLPIIGSPSFIMPENDINPPIIGNDFESWQFVPGLQNPIVQFTFAVRDVTDEVLSATFLDWFFARNGTVDHDTAIITDGIEFWDGRSGFALYGVKADRLSLGLNKNSGISLSATFCASDAEFATSGHRAAEALGAAPTTAVFSNAALLGGQHITWGGALANKIYDAGMELSNNHRPSDAQNGSRFPAEQNASMQTAGLRLRMRASSTPPVDGTPIVATITGANITRVFTVRNPKNQTPKNRQITYPETFRDYVFKCRGEEDNTAPLAYS